VVTTTIIATMVKITTAIITAAVEVELTIYSNEEHPSMVLVVIPPTDLVVSVVEVSLLVTPIHSPPHPIVTIQHLLLVIQHWRHWKLQIIHHHRHLK
jgi:hypothetical protein